MKTVPDTVRIHVAMSKADKRSLDKLCAGIAKKRGTSVSISQLVREAIGSFRQQEGV